MAEQSMFRDRRQGIDRRNQDIAMPVALNRRKGCRRDGNFHSKPWWLKVDYGVEMISEKDCDELLKKEFKPRTKKAPSRNKTIK